MKVFYVTIFCFILPILSIQRVDACNGYTVTVNHARNCIDNSVVSLAGDNGAILDKDCNLAVTGCVEIKKSFKSHVVKYTIKKPPMPAIEGEIDVCEAIKNIKNPTLLDTFKTLNVPTCPVEAKKICSDLNKKINISKYKNQMGMAAGTTDIKLEGTHENGKTCIEINFTLSKEKRTG